MVTVDHGLLARQKVISTMSTPAAKALAIPYIVFFLSHHKDTDNDSKCTSTADEIRDEQLGAPIITFQRVL